MFEVLIVDILFFAIPAAVLLFLGVSIYRYLSAKKKNAKAPESFSESEMKTRKTLLFIASSIAGVFLTVVIGFIALMFLAIAFM